MGITITDVSTARRPPLPELTPQAELAVLARALYRQGFDDQLAGHITYAQPDATLLVTPYGLTWEEINASDVLRIDPDGTQLEGRWDPTPAIAINLEFHARNPAARVAVHNHPRWGTLWAAMHETPPVCDQTSAFVAGEIVVFSEYGLVGERSPAQAVVDALGDEPMALLGNHGVFVVAPDIASAYLRCHTLEWRCRQGWLLRAVDAGVRMPPDLIARLDEHFAAGGYPTLWWEAHVRRELRLDPTVAA